MTIEYLGDRPSESWVRLLTQQVAYILGSQQVIPTGSRFICPDSVTDTSDWDMVFLVDSDNPEDLPSKLSIIGVYSDGGDYESGECQFVSMKYHDIELGCFNAIICFEYDFFRSWEVATQTAKDMDCDTREKRARVFEAILYPKSLKVTKCTE